MGGATEDEIRHLVPGVDYSEALTIVAGETEVREACRQARRYGFRAVVAFPQFLPVLVDQLQGSGVLAQIPVGFPCGGQTTHVKCTEAQEGLKAGATDLDMVMNIAAFKAGDYARVADDIAAVLRVAEPFGVPRKVIIEIGALTDEEKAVAAKMVVDSGAEFIKTCTGWDSGRATAGDIALIRKAAGPEIGIKASGGVGTIADGVAFMRAGATVVAMRRSLVDQLEARQWPEY
jgi:deoxyribose-phosphate aldolase